MRSALSKEDVETLNALQVEAEKVLAGERCWDSRYKAIEARIVLDGIHFIQSIENRFDFYIGTGKVFPDEMISAELNLDDSTSWIARVVDLPMDFPWDGSEVSPSAFTRVIDCLKMLSEQLLRIAPTKDTMALQENISRLPNDVFRYMSGSRSNENLSHTFTVAGRTVRGVAACPVRRTREGLGERDDARSRQREKEMERGQVH